MRRAGQVSTVLAIATFLWACRGSLGEAGVDDRAKRCEDVRSHRGELAEQMGLRARGTESQELIDACKSDGTDAQLACELNSRGLQEADECVERHAPQLAVKRKQILCRARDPSLEGINPLLDEYCADSRLSP